MSKDKLSIQDSEAKQIKERLLEAVDELWDLHLELSDLEPEEEGEIKEPDSSFDVDKEE